MIHWRYSNIGGKMSQEDNTELLERASEMCGEYEGTDVELAIKKAMEDNDLRRLEYLVSNAEAETARQDFEANDAY